MIGATDAWFYKIWVNIFGVVGQFFSCILAIRLMDYVVVVVVFNYVVIFSAVKLIGRMNGCLLIVDSKEKVGIFNFNLDGVDAACNC